MADFPELSRCPEKGVEVITSDSGDLKHKDDAGYVVSRRRYTRSPQQFKITYNTLTDSDYILLKDFILLVGTVSIFKWRCPIDDIVYNVRFDKRPSIVSIPPFYSTTIVLNEV